MYRKFIGHKSGGGYLQDILPLVCGYFKVTFEVCFGLDGRIARACQLDVCTWDFSARHIAYGPGDCRSLRPYLSIS